MSERAIVTPANEPLPVYIHPRVNLGPTSFAELEKFAKLLSDGNFVPAAMKGKPGDIIAAVQFGAEVGLAPLQALHNIAMINGKPSVYGDAMIAICMQHPHWDGYEEEFDERTMTATCTVRRKGMKPVVKTFSQSDAEAAGLWRKPGPWTQYAKVMLAWRAKGFGFRAAFADALKGLISREEASDYITLPAEDYQPVKSDSPVSSKPDVYPEEKEPETLLPAELDMHIREMESAFERGEGGEWWTVNRKEILSRCTQEQRKRFTERKDELKGAGAPPVSQSESPLSSGDQAGGASKPQPGNGRRKKQAEPSEKASMVAEGANKSEALLSLRKKMEEYHAKGSVSGFFQDYEGELEGIPKEDWDWLQSEADALEFEPGV